MRRVALLIALLLCAPAEGQQWTTTNVPSSATIFALAPSGDSVFAGDLTAGVYRSDDRGVTWRVDSAGLNAGSVRSLASGPGCTPCLGTDLGVWRRPDATWRALPDSPQGTIGALLVTGTTVLAARAYGGVARSVDGGATWSLAQPGSGMSTIENVTALALGPTGEVYAAGGSGVFRSRDAGASWEIVNLGLPGDVTGVVADSTRPGTLYAGTTFAGVLRSTDDGDTWLPPLRPDAPIYTNGLTSGSGRLTVFSGGELMVASEGGEPAWHAVTSTGLGVTRPRATAVVGNRLFDGGTGGVAFLDLEAPQPGRPPKVTGVPQAGSTLRADPGAWGGTPTIDLSYRWQRRVDEDWADIPGETTPAYVVAPEDAGRQVRVVETASNGGGQAEQPSAGTGALGAATGDQAGASARPAPTVTHDPQPRVGTAVTVAPGGPWTPGAASFAYAWYRCPGTALTDTCTRLPEERRDSYALTDADVGSTMFVRAIGTNADGSTESSATGMRTPVLSAVPAPSGSQPSIGGIGVVGETLVGVPGRWTNGTRFARRWLRCDASGEACVPVAAFDGLGSIGVVKADIGRTFRFEVTGLPGGPTLRSNQVTAVPRTVPPGAPGRPDQVIPRATARVAPRRVKRSATLRVDVSEPASLAVGVARLVRGRLDHGRCVRATRTRRRRVGCTRALPVAALTRTAATGAHALDFVARRRVGDRRLRVGRYVVTVTPTDAAGNAGLPVRARFRIG